MTKQEFVDLHGEMAWQELVESKQTIDRELEIVQNVNAIVHHDTILPVLRLLGFSGGLVAAKKQIAELQRQEKRRRNWNVGCASGEAGEAD